MWTPSRSTAPSRSGYRARLCSAAPRIPAIAAPPEASFGPAYACPRPPLRRLGLVAVTTTRRAIVRMPARAEPAQVPDDLAVEAPLVLALDGAAIATLMRTPGHDIELAAGWLVVESGVRRPDDVVTLRSCREDDTDRVHIRLREGVRPPRPRAFVTS